VGQLACKFDLDQSERNDKPSTQVHTRPGQTKSQIDSSLLAYVWPGFKGNWGSEKSATLSKSVRHCDKSYANTLHIVRKTTTRKFLPVEVIAVTH